MFDVRVNVVVVVRFMLSYQNCLNKCRKQRQYESRHILIESQAKSCRVLVNNDSPVKWIGSQCISSFKKYSIFFCL